MDLFSLFNKDSDKVLIKEQLEIRNNIFKFENSFIQISNISRVWIGKLKREPFPMYTLYIFLLGLLLMFLSSSARGDSIKSFGFILFLLGGAGMAYYFYRNMESKYGLHIEMNSGGFFVLISTEMQFLEKSAGMISQIVNDYGKKDIAYKYVFNFKHNNIIDNSIENKDGVIVTGSVGGDIVNEDKQ